MNGATVRYMQELDELESSIRSELYDYDAPKCIAVVEFGTAWHGRCDPRTCIEAAYAALDERNHRCTCGNPLCDF